MPPDPVSRQQRSPQQPSAHRFESRVALVTGAASGIGLATARLHAEGAHVVLVDRSRDALNAAVAELGGRADAAPGDVADAERMAAMCRARPHRHSARPQRQGGRGRTGAVLPVDAGWTAA